MVLKILDTVVRSSARLAERFQVGWAAIRGARGPCDISGIRPDMREASASLRAPHQAVSGRALGKQRCDTRSQDINRQVVRIELERCDRLLTTAVVDRVKLGRLGNVNKKSVIGRDENDANVANAITHQTHKGVVTSSMQPSIQIESDSTPVTQIETTGIRILQLNMRRSSVVTGEVRSLIVAKRLDVLLLQEMHVRKKDNSHAIIGLGLGMKVAAARSQRPWAAVAICNPKFEVVMISQLSTTHCACAEVRAPGFSFYVASCYFQHKDGIEEHLRHLEKVFHSLRGQRLIVGMDANARSPMWGDRKLDDKGVLLQSFIQKNRCRLLNVVGQPPTYSATWGSSHIDVTLSSAPMSQFIGDWKVRCDWTTSDHNSIDIRLRVPRVGASEGNERCASAARFDENRADWEKFAESLAGLSVTRLEVLTLQSKEDVENMAVALTDVLTQACAGAMPRKRKLRKFNPWWTKELTIMKKIVYRKRRAAQLERAEPSRLVKVRAYRLSLRRYSREVRKAKRESWRKFVTEHGNSEPWGFVYKHQANKLRMDMVLSTLRGQDSSTTTLEETAQRLLDVHVPEDRENEDSHEQREIREAARHVPETDEAPLFTGVEIIRTVRSLKNKKAPGLDLIEVSVLKAAIRLIPGQFVKLYNGCLQWGVFPSPWKVGSLRVFLKGEDRDVEDPKSYRPICLLSVIGKLFEKLLMKRLTQTALAPRNLSDRQFGFMPGRSTEDAVVELRRIVSESPQRYVIALLFDISGAFDNVWWPLILSSYKERGCPKNVHAVLQDYFRNRTVRISFGDIVVSKKATRGCPQGSVLGPACWNIMFDGLLRLLEAEIGNKFVAYADDLVVLVEGNSRRELEERGQHIIRKIEKWCNGAKLEISARKTEAIVLRSELVKRAPIGRRGGARPDRKRKAVRAKKSDLAKRPPTLKLGNAKIDFKKTVRYLGIHIDSEMGVTSHCKYLNEKVGSLFAKLGRLAGCQWGLRFGVLSVIYRGVFIPTVTYAAAGWTDLLTGSDLEILKTLQRRVLITMTSAYRTASTESLNVIAGAIPIDLIVKEYRARYAIRKERDAEIDNVRIQNTGEKGKDMALIKDEVLKKWQDRWSSSIKGRITSAFFINVRERMNASWIKPNHYVTQMITGHGDFQGRLAALGLVESGMCACGVGRDTAEHHLLYCSLFEPQRVALRDLVPVGDWRWPEAASFLVKSPEAFSVFADYCRETLWLKGEY